MIAGRLEPLLGGEYTPANACIMVLRGVGFGVTDVATIAA